MTTNTLSYLVESYIDDTIVTINDDISDMNIYESYLVHGSPYLYAFEGEIMDKVSNDIKRIVEIIKEKVKNLGSKIKSIIKKVSNVLLLIFDSVSGRTKIAYNRNLVQSQCKYLEECSAKIVKGFALESTMESMFGYDDVDYSIAEEASSNSEYSLIPSLYPRTSGTNSIISNIDDKIQNTINKSQIIKNVKSDISYNDFVNKRAQISAIKSLKSNKRKERSGEIDGDYSELGRRIGNAVGNKMNDLTHNFRSKMSAKRVEKALSRPSDSYTRTETFAKYWNADLVSDKDKMSETLSELEDKNEKNVSNILKSIEGRSEYCKKVLDAMKDKYNVEYPISAVLDANGNGTMSNITISEASAMYHKTFEKCTKYIMSHYDDLRKKTVRLEGKFTHKLLDEIKVIFTICGSLLGIFISMMGLLKSSRGLTINN